MKPSDAKLGLRFLAIIVLLYYLKDALPLPLLAITAALLLAMLSARDALYRKVDSLIARKLPFASKLPQWARWLLVLLAFLAAYVLLKQLLFALLKLFGIDVQAQLLQALNNSLG